MSSQSIAPGLYPFEGLIPKRETGAFEFLRKYPEYDGRGIKMAIFDSGVDPGADGLQLTSTGLPKIVDIHDASGAGDIDTTTVAELDSEGCLKGISGRKLLIPSSWKNASSKWHVGLIKLFSVVSHDFHGAWQEARKLQRWTPKHAEVTAAALNKSPSSGDATAEVVKEELEAQQEVLKMMDDKYEDLGPVMDVVVFHDGQQWWAAVDTLESGDLSKATLLTNYCDQRKYGTIGGVYQLNYTINIHEEGKRLEFVVPQEHGTHVACIAAGCFPDAPERNGLAPGCQIVSIKIGHTLLDGSNETGTSLVRAFLYCMKNQVDIVNISYNEPYNWCNGGRVFEAIEMAVKEYGMIVCVAAGNAGPGFTTVGSLPASPYTLGIGALVTAEMMSEIYGMSYRHPSQMFNWTSRGPGLNGDVGVNICAPGGAIASIPTYTLQNSALMNGTSMASPNACGAIATVLSGLRARNIAWSAFHVRRALENTAKKLDTSCDARMAHGAGLVQCQQAFSWLVSYADAMERDVDISVKVGNSGGGIYIRRQSHLSQDSVYTVIVSASFPKKKLELYPDMFKFYMAVTLSASEEWVRCADCLSLSTGDKAFKLEVRASRLKPGCHFAAVYGYDATKPDKGYVFMVPITVCVPERGNEWSVVRSGELFRPGQAVRRYLSVPQGATWAEWRLEVTEAFDEEEKGSSQVREASSILNFEYHAIQLADEAQYKRHMFKEATSLPVKRVVSACFPVSDRLGVLELAISLFWNRIASVNLNWTLDFHGLKPTVPEIVYQEGEAFYRLDVDAASRSEYWQPSTTLTHLIQPLRPTEFALSALPSSRDTWPDGRITLQLVLQYSFKMDKPATVEVTCPVLLDFLYENEIEGQMWKLYDSNKRLLRCGEARVMRKIDYTAKLSKGEYVIHLQLRHDNRKILERFQDCVLYLRKKLSTPLAFDIVPSYLAALRGAEDKVKPAVLSAGHSTHCFLVPPSADKLGSKPHGGYFLDGWLYFATARDQPADARRNAGAYKLKYILSEPAKSKNKSATATKGASSLTTSKSDVSLPPSSSSSAEPSEDEKKSAEQEGKKDTLDDPILNHQIGLLEKLTDNTRRAEMYRTFVDEAKGPLQVLKIQQAYLSALTKAFETARKTSKQENMKEARDAILAQSSLILKSDLLDERDILALIGTQAETVKDEDKPFFELRKNARIEALYQKCLVLVRPEEDQTSKEEVEETVKQLQKLLDGKTDGRMAEVLSLMYAKHGQLGRAFKHAWQHMELDKKTVADYQRLVELADNLCWHHVAQHLQDQIPILFPSKHELF